MIGRSGGRSGRDTSGHFFFWFKSTDTHFPTSQVTFSGHGLTGGPRAARGMAAGAPARCLNENHARWVRGSKGRVRPVSGPLGAAAPGSRWRQWAQAQAGDGRLAYGGGPLPLSASDREGGLAMTLFLFGVSEYSPYWLMSRRRAWFSPSGQPQVPDSAGLVDQKGQI